MRLARPAAVAAALAAALPASAGVLIEGKSDEGEVQRVLLEGRKMRAEGKAEGGEAMVFDGDAKRMLRLDARKKAWSEFTQADLERIQGEVKKSLEQLPPEQRAQVEEALKASRKPPAPAKWEKTGRTEVAAGKTCDVYRVTHGDDAEEVCVAPYSTFGLSKGDFAALGAFEEFVAQLASAGGGSGGAGNMWRSAPGVPLVTWRLDGQERKESFRATKVEKAKPPASEFQAPPGWTKEQPADLR